MTMSTRDSGVSTTENPPAASGADLVPDAETAGRTPVVVGASADVVTTDNPPAGDGIEVVSGGDDTSDEEAPARHAEPDDAGTGPLTAADAAPLKQQEID